MVWHVGGGGVSEVKEKGAFVENLEIANIFYYINGSLKDAINLCIMKKGYTHTGTF